MVETISLEELEEKLKNDEDFVFIDVLGEDSYQDEHIPGSINIPLDQLAHEVLDRFDKDEEMVVYCGSESCGASPKAAEKLEKLGFEDVKDFEIGLKGWKEAGNEVESGA
ncbi:MAG: rhodanese-like domain-containing protein, partial [Candidatus Nanohaloarchaea archaeon]